MKNDDNFVDLMNSNEETIKLIDQSMHIKLNVNDIFGNFPETFLNNASGQIPLLLNSSHMNCIKHNDSISFLTYADMKLFDSDNIWSNDKVFMCFL